MRPFLTMVLLLVSSISEWAQDATLRRDGNLRKAPNTSSDILESLNSGDSVSIISKGKRFGYYHVRVQNGTAGWLWARNLTISTTAGTSKATTGHPSLALTVPPGLLAQLAAATVVAVPKPLLINGHQVCGPKGNATNPKMQALDSEKNRTDVPDHYIPISWDQLKSLPATNPAKYEGAPVSVEGYLSSQVKEETAGNGESTNCNLTQPDEVDWHMYLTKQSNQPISKAIIVETTPRTRPQHHWDKSVLDNVVNQPTKVRISGWTMYDFQHKGEVNKHRISVWEVHPITRIELDDGNGGWKDIEQ